MRGETMRGWERQWTRVIATLVAGAVLLLVGGCDEDSNDNGPMGDANFSSTVLPIVQQSCATSGCHASTSPSAGLRLDGYDAILAGSDDGEAVIPFSPDRSLLVEMLEGRAASTPDHSTLVSSADIATLRDWIDDGCPDDLGIPAFADTENKVYVTGQGADLVSVISVEDLVVTRLVTVEAFGGGLTAAPHFGAVAPSGTWIVTMLQAPGVWSFDAGDSVLAKLETARPMAALAALTPGGTAAYVTHFIDPQAPTPGYVTVVDMATLAARDEVRVLNTPHGIAMSNDGREVFVANWGSDHITVIETANDEVVAHIPVSERVRGNIESFDYRILQIATHPTESWIYASCTTSPDSPAGEIRVVDRAQGTVIDSLAVPAGSAAPWHLKATPDGNKLYVANRGQQLGSGPILPGTVSVYSTSPFALVTTISSPSLALPHGLDFDADGRYCFVSSENLNGAYTARHPIDGENPGVLTVIDTATDQVVKVLEVEAFATGVFATR